jgi:hypothetical protein
VADIYWYISADKIKSLKESRTLWDKLALRLKLKFLEIETGVSFDNSLQKDLKKVEKELKQDPRTLPFQELTTGSEGRILSFEGEGSRLLTPEALWIATYKENFALLLVGAPRNPAGQSQLKEGVFSPSLDPVWSVKALAEGEQPLVPALTSAWCRVMQDAVSMGAHFPKIEGLAVFAGLFPSDGPLLKDITGRDIDTIVLGSPIYVRQV